MDARSLQGDDVVRRTLDETAGMLGVITRPKIVDFNARLKERKRAGIRSMALRIGIGVAVAVVLAAVTWLLLWSPVFMLERDRIEISGGNEWVSEQQIMSIAEQQEGKSLFLVSTGTVEDQLNQIPGVTQAQAVKQYPKSLQVTVKAQKPAAMLKTSDGTMTAVDSKGRVLNAVKDVSVDGIPVIQVRNVELGLRNRAVQAALKILGSLPESWRVDIAEVTADTQDSITTRMKTGDRTIVWGDASELTLKKAVVDKIINDPNVIGDKHNVDVSAPLRPIIK